LAFLRQIIAGDDDLLEVRNYHHFALGYLKSRGLPTDHAVAQHGERRELTRSALRAAREESSDAVLERGTDFFSSEFAWMGRHGIASEDDYLAADRVGRIQPLTRSQRSAVYAARRAYERAREEAGLSYDWDDLATAVIDQFEVDDEPRRYRHIVIDEGQDFSLQMLRSLVYAVDPEGSFTLFGDAAQQIYGRGISWRSAGIEVSKVWEFAHNYRTPRRSFGSRRRSRRCPTTEVSRIWSNPTKMSTKGRLRRCGCSDQRGTSPATSPSSSSPTRRYLARHDGRLERAKRRRPACRPASAVARGPPRSESSPPHVTYSKLSSGSFALAATATALIATTVEKQGRQAGAGVARGRCVRSFCDRPKSPHLAIYGVWRRAGERARCSHPGGEAASMQGLKPGRHARR